MIRKIAKAAAYAKAPKATFATLHPLKALKYGAILWVGKKIFGGKERRAGA